MNKSEAKFEYDIQKRARAGTTATLRAAVAIYIAFLGRSVIRGVREGGSSVPPWLGWTAGLTFIAAAIGVCVYAWRRWRLDLAAARLPESDAEPEEESHGTA